MKLISSAFGMAAMCAVAVGAQTQTTNIETKRTIEVKDGKKITITGCLDRNASGGYMLNSTEYGGRQYALVTDKDLSKHVGHRIAVRGKATDMGDGKVKIDTKVGTSGSADGDDKKTDKAKAELKGTGLHYLGVDSIKMIAKSCV